MSTNRVRSDDFETVKTIGRGAFGEVRLVSHESVDTVRLRKTRNALTGCFGTETPFCQGLIHAH